jgi:hypothetical protein
MMGSTWVSTKYMVSYFVECNNGALLVCLLALTQAHHHSCSFQFLLPAGMQLYQQVGEKTTTNKRDWTEESRTQKKNDAKKCADMLLEKSEWLRKKKEEDEKAKAAAKAAGAVKRSPSTLKVGTAKRAKISSPAGTPRARPKLDKKTFYLNKRVSKAFPMEDNDGKLRDEIYFGTVDYLKHADEPYLWHIQYDDDDEEEFDEKDMKVGLKLYEKHEREDKNKPQGYIKPMSEPAAIDVDQPSKPPASKETAPAPAAAKPVAIPAIPAPVVAPPTEKPAEAPAPASAAPTPAPPTTTTAPSAAAPPAVN